MRAGRLIRFNSEDHGTHVVSRVDVLREAIEHCGDDPENAATRAQLQKMLDQAVAEEAAKFTSDGHPINMNTLSHRDPYGRCIPPC